MKTRNRIRVLSILIAALFGAGLAMPPAEAATTAHLQGGGLSSHIVHNMRDILCC